MIAESTVTAIQNLLQVSTLSQREIARRVGVNRETVNRIATGKRLDYVEIREQQQRESPREIIDPVRCKRCGAMINVIPCQKCAVERKQQGCRSAGNRGTSNGAIPPVGIELKGEERRRYEQIRLEKLRRGERPTSNLALLHQALFEGEIPMAAFERIRYIRWFLAHVGQLLPLLELPELLREATSIRDKWDLLKWAGDKVIDLVDQFPSDEEVRAQTLEGLRAEVETLGIPWDRLIELLPILIRIIRIIQDRELANV